MSYKYENGFVVEQLTMEKPYSIDYAYLDEIEKIIFHKNLDAYNDYIKNLRRYPVPEQYRHVWKEGDLLEEGKDFETLFKRYPCKDKCQSGRCHSIAECIYVNENDFVAIPIEPKQAVKPPIGLMPEWRHKELRLEEINDAIDRYYESNYSIPKKWLLEQESLIKWLRKYLPTSPPIESKQDDPLNDFKQMDLNYCPLPTDRQIGIVDGFCAGYKAAIEAYRNQYDDRLQKAIEDAFNAAREELEEVSIEWRLAGKPFHKYSNAKQYLQSLTTQNKPV